jgi:2'-hydroxyisoflavone reductase
VRVDAAGEVLAPASPQEPVQYIDARDLAAFAVRTVEASDGGTYNCVTPRGSLHFGDLLEACSRAAHSRPTFSFVDAEFLREHQVNPWSDMPLWIPPGDPHRGITSANSARALARGLITRSLTETVRDTLDWARAAGKRIGTLQAGLSPEREEQLLNEYRARASVGR